MTVKLHVVMLPEASVAVQVTVVVPAGKAWPDVTTWLFWFLQTTLTPGQLSDAVTVKLTGALVAIGHEAAGAVVTLAGQVTTGGVLSVTVTLNVQPGPAVLVQVTVVVPTGKQLPEAGLHVTVPQLPLVVGAG